MSHIVEIKTEVRDEAAVQSACSRLHLHVQREGRSSCIRQLRPGWGSNCRTGSIRLWRPVMSLVN